MQRDLATQVALQLNGSNPEAVKPLIEVIKSQASEIQKRGARIVDLEDKNDILQKNLNIIASSNKQLESMIETMRSERQKLLEEIEELKGSSPEVKSSTRRSRRKETGASLETA